MDDDPDVRDSLQRALRHAGYAVSTAVHGADALDALARSPVDLTGLEAGADDYLAAGRVTATMSEVLVAFGCFPAAGGAGCL